MQHISCAQGPRQPCCPGLCSCLSAAALGAPRSRVDNPAAVPLDVVLGQHRQLLRSQGLLGEGAALLRRWDRRTLVVGLQALALVNLVHKPSQTPIDCCCCCCCCTTAPIRPNLRSFPSPTPLAPLSRATPAKPHTLRHPHRTCRVTRHPLTCSCSTTIHAISPSRTHLRQDTPPTLP